jgi:flotillin
MDFLLGAVVFAAVVAVLVIMWIVGNLFRRVGPNRALIVYGWGGTHIVTGGGKVVWPLFQSFQELSLELMSFDVAPEQQLYTSQGVAVAVEAVSQIKVKSDPQSIRTASEQFLTKPPAEREALLRLVMEGHLRGIVGLLKVEEIVKEPEIVAGRVRDSVSDDLTKMGLEVVSFTIKKVIDENDYINNMGRPDIARVKREADIAQAEAERDTAIKRAMAMREAAVAQAQADQERVIAQTASETKQAEATRDLEVTRPSTRRRSARNGQVPRRPMTSPPIRRSRRSLASRSEWNRSNARNRSASRSWRFSGACSSWKRPSPNRPTPNGNASR